MVNSEQVGCILRSITRNQRCTGTPFISAVENRKSQISTAASRNWTSGGYQTARDPTLLRESDLRQVELRKLPCPQVCFLQLHQIAIACVL